MPVPKTVFYTLAASNANGSSANTKTIPIPPNSDIRAHVQLNQVTSAAPDWAVTAEITDFVQNGLSHPGNVFLIAGHNITEVTFVVSVANASAIGTILIEFF